MRFILHLAWTLGARLFIAGGSLLAGVLVARLLGAASVGIIASLNVITLVTLTFGGIGVPSAITFLVARDREKMKRVLLNAMVFAIATGGILTAAVLVLTQLKPTLFGETPTNLVTIIAFAIPFQFLQLCCLGVLLGIGSIGRYNLFDMLAQAFLVLNPLIFVWFFGLGLKALVTANVVSSALLTTLTLITLLQKASAQNDSERLRFDPSLMREMLRYGSKFYVAMAASVVILRADLLIVNYFRGSTEAGVYAVSTQVGTLLMLIPGVISTVLFPRVTEAREASGQMTCRVMRHAVPIMLLVCLAAIPLAFLLPHLYGPAFTGVPSQVLILLPGVYLLGLETVQVQYFSSLGLPAAIPAFWLITMVITVVLDIVLVPGFGANAAAAVSSGSYAIMFVLVAVYFRTKTSRSFKEAFLIRGGELRELLSTRNSFSTFGEEKA